MATEGGFWHPGELADDPILDRQIKDQVEIAIKYQGYIDRQSAEISRHEHFEGLNLPANLDYLEVHGLSAEAQQKLNFHKPTTLGHAARISGVTPAAISLLLVHLRKGLGKSTAPL